MKYLFALSTLFLLFSCTEETNNEPIYELVDAKVFKEKMKLDNVQIIDVRTLEEISDGRIGDAACIDFLDPEFKNSIDKLKKDRPTLVYCAKGGRSTKAIEIMKELGFQELYELEGGYDSWE